MSDTPRTTAAAQFIPHFGWQVHAATFEALERELAAVTAERDRLRDDLAKFISLCSHLEYIAGKVQGDRDRMRPVVEAAQAFVNSRASDGYAPEAALIDAVDIYEAAT